MLQKLFKFGAKVGRRTTYGSEGSGEHKPLTIRCISNQKEAIELKTAPSTVFDLTVTLFAIISKSNNFICWL